MTNKSLIIAIVLVIIIGGGLGWYFISNSDSGSNDTNVSNSNINLYITENQKRMEACETWGGTWSSNSLGEEFCSNLSDEENKIGYCDDANGTMTGNGEGTWCEFSYADAGKSCTSSDQCEGNCVTNKLSNLGREGTCQLNTTTTYRCDTPIEKDYLMTWIGDMGFSCSSTNWESMCDTFCEK